MSQVQDALQQTPPPNPASIIIMMASSYLRYLARRLAFTLSAIFVGVTATFSLATVITWKQLHDRVAYAEYCVDQFCPDNPPDPEVMRHQFKTMHNLYVPVHERYLIYLTDGITLNWGYSPVYQQPIYEVLTGSTLTTLEYLLPGLTLALLLGIAAGILAAFKANSSRDWTIRVVAYAMIGIPAFVSAYILSTKSSPFQALAAGLNTHHIASIAVALSILGGQIRFSRAAALPELDKEFTRLLTAKGLSPLQVARHIVRNAATTIASGALLEVFTLITINVYVIEAVLNIQGLASVNLQAIQAGDVQLTMWSAFIFMLLGITANLLQDIVYGFLDPRTTN